MKGEKSNLKFCVITGHGKSKSGGYDPGAVSGKYQEFRIAKEIAKYTNEYLRSYGNESKLINYDGSLYLTERIEKINASDFDFALEIHLNAGGGTGTEVFYPSGDTEAQGAARAVSESISKALSVRNRGAKTRLNSAGKDYFGIIRSTKIPTLLIETVFIDTSDIKKVETQEGQKACGKAIALALNGYFADSAKKSGEYTVRIVTDLLNVRSGPGTQYKINTTVKRGEVFTVVEKKGSWGRLKSGAGWISLNPDYAERAA